MRVSGFLRSNATLDKSFLKLKCSALFNVTHGVRVECKPTLQHVCVFFFLSYEVDPPGVD